MHTAHFIRAIAQSAGENIILIGRNDEAIDRQAHALGHIAGQNVAKIAGWHSERDRAMRATQHNGAGEVINNLRHDTRPINRIHA